MHSVKTILASAAMLAVASAQSLSDLTSLVNPDAGATCTTALTGGVVTIASSCGLLNNASLFQNATVDSLLNALATKPEILNAFCSSSCSSAISGGNSTLGAACGQTPIFNPNVTQGNSLIANTTVTQFLSEINWLKGVTCNRDNNKYCVPTQISSWNSTHSGTPFTLDAALADKNFTCTACTKLELDAAGQNTNGVPANVLSALAPYIKNISDTLATCPSGSLNAQGNGASGQLVAGYSVVVAAVVAGLTVLFA